MIQKSKIQMAKGLCLFAGVALGAAVLTGCSSEDINSRAQGDGHPKVQVTATVLSADPQTATRADDGLNIASTGFSDNTKTVYIGVNKGSAGADTWQGYEFGISGTGGSQSLTAPVSNGPEFPSGVTSVSVYGWYPYNNGNKTFSVLADQSTNANYNASDLMLANSQTCSHDGSSVTAADLTFRHALTKMKVTVTPGADVTINSITLKSMKPTVTINDDNKTSLSVGSADGSPTDITLFSGESTAAVTQCAVFPGQEKAAGALLVVNATANGGSATDVTYSLDGAKTFTADKQYVMNISLNATAVAAGSVTLTDWETASGTVTVNAGGGAGSLALDQNTMTLVYGGNTGSLAISGSVTLSGSGTPSFSATSSNTSVATVAVSGTTITVTPAATGAAVGTTTVTVTDGNNNENTATCLVTVNKPADALLSAVNSGHVGYAVGLNGRVYETLEALNTDNTTCVGVLAYSGSTGHGLIMALQNAASQTWGTINGWSTSSDFGGKSGKLLPDDTARSPLASYSTLGSMGVSNWIVLSEADYKLCFQAMGSAYTYNNTSNGLITAAGGSALGGIYWSTSNYGNGERYFDSSGWSTFGNGGSRSVRPVLAF